MAAELVHPYKGTGFIIKGKPIAVGFCENPVAESEGKSFTDTFSGEISATFTMRHRNCPIKGNRRQRKAAAYANNKTVWGLVNKYDARSQKADKKRARMYTKKFLRAEREYKYLVAMRDAQIRRYRQQEQHSEGVPLVWQHWDEVTEYMKKQAQNENLKHR